MYMYMYACLYTVCNRLWFHEHNTLYTCTVHVFILNMYTLQLSDIPSRGSIIVCHRVQRPVRIMLDRNEDMVSSGGRHPFLGRYKVGFTSEGRITALDLRLYSNGGTSQDLSCAVSRGLCVRQKRVAREWHFTSTSRPACV